MGSQGRKIIILDGSEDAELLQAIAAGQEITSGMLTGLTAEGRAMLQSLYSRSPKSVCEHLPKVAKGAAKFMEQYYVNYGHKSIGDCGFITLFVEGVSMLVAKAFQDTQLYVGQEASTRYLDFSVVPFLNPLETPEGAQIIKDWYDFYTAGLGDAEFRASLKARFPIKPGEKEDAYDRAIAARAFDIMRGFLPFSATTFVAWTVNLRQAADRLEILRNHPHQEVAEVAEEIIAQLITRYPSSFKQLAKVTLLDSEQGDAARAKLFERQKEAKAYLTQANLASLFGPEKHPDLELTHTIDTEALKQYQVLLDARPKYQELPAWMGELGQVKVKTFLDGGSWRDIQRQRAGIIRFPLFTTDWGMYPWYLEQLTDGLRKEAKNLIGIQVERIKKLPADPVMRQNYIAMGFKAPLQLTFPLPGFVYLLELRSGKTVHPTLRALTQQMAREFHKEFPDLKLYVDWDESDWDAKRGTQTIMTADGKAISDK